MRDFGVSRSWLYELLARYRAEGETAFEPRSRRPHTSPAATPADTVDLILALRKQLRDDGLDAGTDTIGRHLAHHHDIVVSRPTIHRTLHRHGEVIPEPAKRPHQLRRLGIVQKNSRPAHPTTCGKVERFQQTMKNWLTAQPGQPATLGELQALLDTFVEIYNHHRPHRSLPHRATPATIYTARPKATPGTSRATHTCALPGATALAQARQSGVFTAAHQAYWDAARAAKGDTLGTRWLIEILLAHRTHRRLRWPRR